MLTTILTLLGGGLGGLLRYIPEIFKLFNDKADRSHEYRMTQLQLEIEFAKAKQQMLQTQVEGEIAEHLQEMTAYIEAIKGQSNMSGVKWIDALNQSVRPVLTYWWMILFTVYKITDIQMGGPIWSVQDWGILSMILGFWFVDRAIRYTNGR